MINPQEYERFVPDPTVKRKTIILYKWATLVLWDDRQKEYQRIMKKIHNEKK